MNNYQPFLISEFKTGLYNYLSSWIRPQDAFEPLVNAYVYRGVLQKRNGSTIFGNQLADHLPVMGIMQYQNETNGTTALVVASTKNLYLYSPSGTPDGGTFGPLVTVGGSNSIFWMGTATGTITVPTFWPNFANGPGTIFITDGTTTVSFGAASGGVGTMTGAGGIFASGSIVYSTGIVTLAFSGTTAGVSLSISGTLTTPTTLVGGYFTGTIANFFNSTNWQPTSSVTSIAPSYLYMVNNVDPLTIFDGTNLARPILYVDSGMTTYIKTALDVKTYGNRLLMILPTISGEANPANQDIYYSALFSPFDFVGDIAGHGGAISAATGDQIISAKFLRDVLVVAFTASTWSFQLTGLTSPPYLFRRLNVSKSNKCPYAGISYDERVTNLGNTGFLACDGVNVQRYDIPIIDYYETLISQKYFNQDFALRYDNLNQTWMFYPSFTDQFPVINSVAPGSDQTLVYNFLESTWATYKNSFPMTCMGISYVTSGTTWAELNVSPQNEWEETQASWDSYSIQTTSPILLGGDTTGNVYHMDNALAVRDGESSSAAGTSFNVEIKTTRWNPFIGTGQKTQFGYVDVYYSISSTDPANAIQVTFNFFVDNFTNTTPQLSKTLTFDGPAESGYAWKRVYCNLVGEFVQIEIDPSEDAPFQILGFILWARPAGRLTP